MKKKILAILLLFCLSISIIACEKPDNGDDPNTIDLNSDPNVTPSPEDTGDGTGTGENGNTGGIEVKDEDDGENWSPLRPVS